MAKDLIEIRGIEECCRMFEHAPKEVVPGAIRSGLVAGAAVIESAIRGKTKVRAIRKGGDAVYPALVTDLGTTIESGQGGGAANIGFADQGYVAGFIEYGHLEVGHGKSKEGRRLLGEVEPHPFMRPAADESGDEAVNEMEKAIMAELEKGQIIDGA